MAGSLHCVTHRHGRGPLRQHRQHLLHAVAGPRDRLARWRVARADWEDKERGVHNGHLLLLALVPAMLTSVASEGVSLGLSKYLARPAELTGPECASLLMYARRFGCRSRRTFTVVETSVASAMLITGTTTPVIVGLSKLLAKLAP